MVEQLSFGTLPQALRVRPGITAVVGSGGKTSLLAALAGLLAGRRVMPGTPGNAKALLAGRAGVGVPDDARASGGCRRGGAVDGGPTVVLTTSTRIYPFAGAPVHEGDDADGLRRLLAAERAVCCGTPAAAGKLAAPALSFGALARCADNVLVEADGSKHRPLKAHADHEPAVPRETERTVIVVGASGFGRTVGEAAHRPELFCERAGCRPDDETTPERVARVLRAEGLLSRLPNPCVVVNQVDTADQLTQAKQLSKMLGAGVLATSLRKRLLYSITPDR